MLGSTYERFAPVPLLPAHPAVQLRLGGRLMPERGPASMAERRLHRRRTARGGCAPTRAAVPGRALVRNGGRDVRPQSFIHR